MSAIDYNARLHLLKQWICQHYQIDAIQLQTVSGDASFRRYFRFNYQGQDFIAVDAPPEHENSHPFVAVAELLLAQGVNVPQIIQRDLNLGFMILTDFGNTLLGSALTPQTVDALYARAIEALLHIQTAPNQVPPYDEALLMREMALFKDWYLQRHLQLQLTDAQNAIIQDAFDFLKQSALSQPQVFVHRDYHSRNLMLVPAQDAVGVIDFQDAVWGPVTYDLVSLLRDCYVKWPLEQVHTWALDYYRQALEQGILSSTISESDFMRWFDLMGIQRHLKASGIFARLNYRDGKSGYLKDIPRTVQYILDVAPNYPEMGDFLHFLQHSVVPHLYTSTCENVA